MSITYILTHPGRLRAELHPQGTAPPTSTALRRLPKGELYTWCHFTDNTRVSARISLQFSSSTYIITVDRAQCSHSTLSFKSVMFPWQPDCFPCAFRLIKFVILDVWTLLDRNNFWPFEFIYLQMFGKKRNLFFDS